MPARKTTVKKPAAAAPLKDRVIRAALDLSAEKGWGNVTMGDIAAACRCSMGDLQEIFEERIDILIAYGRHVDRRVLDAVAAPDQSTPERDRLFDVMMERFDVLNEDRDAVCSMLRSCRRDPKQALTGFPCIGRSMIWMLEAAGIPVNGPRGTVIALGLVGIYLYTLRIWADDNSPDMGKTMAALDRALERAEGLCNRF